MVMVKMEAYVDRNNIPHTEYPTLWWGNTGITISNNGNVVWLKIEGYWEFETLYNGCGHDKLLCTCCPKIKEVKLEEINDLPKLHTF